MNHSKTCSSCGADLPPGSDGGQCPECLEKQSREQLPKPAGTVMVAIPGISATEKPGDQIGRYKLLQQIGEGGMGTVWMAEQYEPVRRKVALKVVKLGMDTKQVVARFEAERQALALMDHPGIAKVLDAGATETGRPFFVMELVKGIRITDYCDQNNLPTVERLGLFMKICQAIQHAHQKGIIHRDIKPSNILVTVQEDGIPTPKIIDFGIAKAIAGQVLTDKTLFTAFEQFIGTPAYMSPEQAEMTTIDIDTRSDIYSLGILLYELLTGRTPFDPKELLAAGLDEMRRMIREEEPQRPSTRLSTLQAAELTATAKHRRSDPPRLIHLIRGDLDWIVMKALEKDRTRRYETANGLAIDVQRHLNNEPIVARPAGNVYRFRKFVRRNKFVFASASVIFLVLLAGITASTWMAVRATRAEREEANALDRATRAEREDANALDDLGFMYWKGVTRDYSTAINFYRQAADRGNSWGSFNLGVCYQNGYGVPTNYAEAVKWYRQSAAQGNMKAEYCLGMMYEDGHGVIRNPPEALKLVRKAVEQGDSDAQGYLGFIYSAGMGVTQDYAEAVKWYQASADQGNPQAEYQLGNCYQHGQGVTKDPVEAVKWYRKSAEQEYADGEGSLGFMYWAGAGVTKDYAEAIRWYQASAILGNSEAEDNLGVCYENGYGVAKDFAKAVEWFQASADHGNPRGEFNLGNCYQNGQGVAKDAVEAVNWYRKSADQGDAEGENSLGFMYWAGAGVTKDYAQAVKWYRKSADQGESEAECNLGVCYESGCGVAINYAEAVNWYRKSADKGNADAQNRAAWLLATCIRNGPEAVQYAEKAVAQWRVPNTVDTLAAAYAEAGRFSDAISTEKNAIALLGTNAQDTKKDFQARLDLYGKNIPYRK